MQAFRSIYIFTFYIFFGSVNTDYKGKTSKSYIKRTLILRSSYKLSASQNDTYGTMKRKGNIASNL